VVSIPSILGICTSMRTISKCFVRAFSAPRRRCPPQRLCKPLSRGRAGQVCGLRDVLDQQDPSAGLIFCAGSDSVGARRGSAPGRDAERGATASSSSDCFPLGHAGKTPLSRRSASRRKGLNRAAMHGWNPEARALGVSCAAKFMLPRRAGCRPEAQSGTVLCALGRSRNSVAACSSRFVRFDVPIASACPWMMRRLNGMVFHHQSPESLEVESARRLASRCSQNVP